MSVMYLNLPVYLIVFIFIGCVFILWYFVLQFFVFFSFSYVLQVYLNLRVCLFVFVFIVEVLLSFCICWVERNFFSLAVFGGNLLAGHAHSSVALDRHVQARQWTGSISLLTWGLLWASAFLREAWDRNGVSLEKCVSSHAEWLQKRLAVEVVASLSYY